MARELARVGVVGLGTMGAGIAEVLARAGLEVTAVDLDDERLEHGRRTIVHSTDRAVERGKLDRTAQADLLGRLTLSTDSSALAEAELVVEAVVEHLDVKRQVFTDLDAIVGADTVLATNTSSLSVTEISAATSRPGRVLGLHFFNPAPVMRLIEVVSTVATSAGVADDVAALCVAVGKRPVSCTDRAGFIVNALLFPYLNDAVRMLQEHYASAEDIDIAMKRGCRLPMGPFELLDVVGNDVSLAIQRTLFAEFREPGWAPAPLLEHLVTAGYLGRKTGRGFHDYSTA